MARYRATYTTGATVTVFVDLPEDFDPEVDDVEDYVGEHSHDLATEHIQTWGAVQPVLLDLDLDGIGADTIEAVDD